jgi:hypothetical protein
MLSTRIQSLFLGQAGQGCGAVRLRMRRHPAHQLAQDQRKSEGNTPMNDPTEAIRRQMVAQINAVEGSREYLQSRHGQVWDTSELQEDFEVLGFLAPFVIARRKSDGIRGSLLFQNSPRIFFGFQPE